MLRNRSGFTLLETMIAMAIMMVAFSSILMVESSSLNTSTKAKMMSIVSMLAKNKMSEIELELEGRSFTEVKAETSFENFKEPYQDLKWKRVIKEVVFPSMSFGSGNSNVSSSSSGNRGSADGAEAAEERFSKIVTKFLSKAVREVTLTIAWKRGSGEQTYSVSMYWVDLNHEFNLSE